MLSYLCERGQLRDITCCPRYFLVNVLKIVNGRKSPRFKTFVRQQRHSQSMGQSSLGSGSCSCCPGKRSLGSSKGQRQWKGSFSATGAGTLLQPIPSGHNCKPPEGGKGNEEGISVNFWKSYKFLTLIHCDVLCFVLSGPLPLWGKSFHVSWILVKTFPMPALFIHVYEVCLYSCFSKCHHKSNIIKHWKKNFPNQE